MLLSVFDYLHRHKSLMWTLLVSTTILFAVMVSTLNYREDIADFLPLDSKERQTMDIYQDISGASRLVVIFENLAGEDTTVMAIEHFVDEVHKRDTLGWSRGMLSSVNTEQQAMLMDFVRELLDDLL